MLAMVLLKDAKYPEVRVPYRNQSDSPWANQQDQEEILAIKVYSL